MNTKRWAKVFLSLLIFAGLTFAASSVMAGKKDYYNVKKDGVALGGYDAVAYFQQGKAVRGRAEFSYQNDGITYLFGDKKNLKKFKKKPKKYLPAYGGWCATSLAKGEYSPGNPHNFKLSEGRLFLFYKGIYGDRKTEWQKDQKALIAKADANWKKKKKEMGDK